MTRARDRLYVAGFEGRQGRARGCWYELIEEQLRATLIEVTQADGTTRAARERGAVGAAAAARGTQIADATDAVPLPPWAQARQRRASRG